MHLPETVDGSVKLQKVLSNAQSMTHRRLIISGTFIGLEHHSRFDTVAGHEEIAGHSNIGCTFTRLGVPRCVRDHTR